MDERLPGSPNPALFAVLPPPAADHRAPRTQSPAKRVCVREEEGTCACAAFPALTQTGEAERSWFLLTRYGRAWLLVSARSMPPDRVSRADEAARGVGSRAGHA